MNKTNILVWAVILLALLNIATIGTIIYHNVHENDDQVSVVLDTQSGTMLNGRFMKQEMNFDENQMEKFRTARQKFQPEANQIIVSIDFLKAEMFNELNKNTTDSLKLDKLSQEIGALHAKLKENTAVFYLEIKSICKPDQRKQLESIFTPLFYDENSNHGQGNGNGGGRHRHGNGFKNQP